MARFAKGAARSLVLQYFLLNLALCKNVSLKKIIMSKTISRLEIYDMESGTHKVIREFDFLIEAPNWSPDGKWLVYNSEGRLYRIATDGKGEPSLI